MYTFGLITNFKILSSFFLCVFCVCVCLNKCVKEHYAQIGQSNCIKKINCKLPWLVAYTFKRLAWRKALFGNKLSKRFERFVGQKG